MYDAHIKREERGVHIDKYDSLDLVFQNELFNMININKLLDSWTNQIKSSVEKAHETYGDQEPSLHEWMDNVNYLRYSIEQSLN